MNNTHYLRAGGRLFVSLALASCGTVPIPQGNLPAQENEIEINARVDRSSLTADGKTRMVQSRSGNSVHIDSTSSKDANGNFTLYQSGKGEGVAVKSSFISHSSPPGSYTVSLTVTDNQGGSATQSITITAPGGKVGASAAETKDSASEDQVSGSRSQ